MSLFGHHHADPSVVDRIVDVVHAVPVPIWVAAIGVAAAVAAPFVQHLFARSRDKSLAAADDRRRAEETERAVARVRADLLVRVRAHVAFLDAAGSAGAIDLDRWQRAFESLAVRTRDPDVIDALAASYHEFVRPVHAESVAIELERARMRAARDGLASTAPLAAIVAAYEPVPGLLGEPAGPNALPPQKARAT